MIKFEFNQTNQKIPRPYRLARLQRGRYCPARLDGSVAAQSRCHVFQGGRALPLTTGTSLIFKIMEVMKIWLTEYVVFHHRLFIIKHSDENKRYIITCCHGCLWSVRARKGKDGG